MTCNDDRGLQVLDACRRAQVMVPDEVAVISVDNDDYLCGLSIPPLTSIDVLPQRIGYEAAALFRESQYLSRAFRRVTGQTPGQYRKQARR